MANKLRNRTVEPDGDAIQRLRIEKGWRVEDLAKKARCSLKTVENVVVCSPKSGPGAMRVSDAP
jgi:ribosome-binding protein aMBF1 (putative translation factor)